MKLLINGDPYKEVTLTGNEYRRTLTTNENGEATFTLSKSGTYTMEATLANGKKFSKQITVFNEFHEKLPKQQVKDLPLKSKIKLSNGLKMILMNKNLKTHPSNSATFVSEYAMDSHLWDIRVSGKYTSTSIYKMTCPRYYNTLSDGEKEAIIYRTFTHCWADGELTNGGDVLTEEIRTYFYIPSEGDVGGKYIGVQDSVNIGFQNNNDRKKTLESGAQVQWTTRSAMDNIDQNAEDVFIVNETGEITRVKAYTRYEEGRARQPVLFALVSACDISQDAYVVLGDNGYWHIVGL